MFEPEEQDRQQEARDPATSSQRLETLSAYPELRPLVASNPVTPAHVLAPLASDPNALVRQAVAGNPNTPWQTLEKLAIEFPHEFLHNPVGSLQLMAHPEQISTDGVFRAALLREAPLPSLWWNWLGDHSESNPDDPLRSHIQTAGETPHWYGVPRQGDEWELLILVELISAALAQGMTFPALTDPLLSETSLKQIIRDHLQWLSQSASEEWWWMEGWGVVASNELMPEELLQTLAQNEEGNVRQAVASHSQTPVEILRALATDQDFQVRSSVAESLRTTADILCILATDQNYGVRLQVAGNGRTPSEVLHTLAQNQEMHLAVANNPQAPREILSTLTWDRQADVRRAVASNPQVPPEALNTLAQDQERKVRSAVANNPRTPTEALQTLAQDYDSDIRLIVASHPRIPGELLETLAQERRDSRVRSAVAGNLQTPAEALRMLAQDQEATVRENVASNPRTPMDVLQALAQDCEAAVRGNVAWNKHTPVELLHVLVQDHDAGVQRLANLVLRLLSEAGEVVREQDWWEQLRLFFRDSYGSKRIETEAIESQLEPVLELDTSDAFRQAIIAAVAVDWSITSIMASFEPSEEPEIEAFIETKRSYYQLIMTPFMPAIALQKLAASHWWEVRYLVALHNKTPRETRQRLSQDGNRYVRAMARAKLEMRGEQTL